jgi:hypothetical protein
MNITKEMLLLVAAAVGLSFVILSNNGIVEFSIAQQQKGNQTQNNTNMIQEPKFLKNSTSYHKAFSRILNTDYSAMANSTTRSTIQYHRYSG